MINIEVLSTFQCDICEETIEKRTKVLYGWAVPIPSLPEGWRIIDGKTVCPNHEVCFVDKRGVNK